MYICIYVYTYMYTRIYMYVCVCVFKTSCTFSSSSSSHTRYLHQSITNYCQEAPSRNGHLFPSCLPYQSHTASSAPDLAGLCRIHFSRCLRLHVYEPSARFLVWSKPWRPLTLRITVCLCVCVCVCVMHQRECMFACVSSICTYV